MTSTDESTEDRRSAPALSGPSAGSRARCAEGQRRVRRLVRPSRTAHRLLSFAVLPVALVLATFAVAGPSYSVFNGTSSDAPNAWTAGAVSLQNTSSGSAAQTGAALFTLSGLQPGSSGSRCVAVTSTGSVPAPVSLYVTGVTPSGTGSLPSYLSMTVTMGTGSSGTNGDCTGYSPTGTLATNVHLDALPTTFGTGATGWTATPGTDTRIFKFTYTVDMTVPNTLQNSAATATLVWEGQTI